MCEFSGFSEFSEFSSSCGNEVRANFSRYARGPRAVNERESERESERERGRSRKREGDRVRVRE